MKSVDDIAIRLEMMETLASSLEKAIDSAILASGMSDEALMVQHLFYILSEQINQAKAETLEVAGHIKVCNAISAVNRVEDLKAEIKRLRDEKA